MASEQISFVLSSSSGSSEGVQSHNGTPDTKGTAFSPEETRFNPNGTGNASIKGIIPGHPHLGIQRSNFVLPKFLDDASSCHGSDWDVDETDQLVSGGNLADPFVTSANSQRHRSTERKLSPTASCFTPGAGFENGTPESSQSGSSVGGNTAPTHSEPHGLKQEPATNSDNKKDVKHHSTCVADGSTSYPSSTQAGTSSDPREGGRLLTTTTHTPSEGRRMLPIVRFLVIQGHGLQEGSVAQSEMFKAFITAEIPAIVNHHTIMDATIPGKVIIGFSAVQDCEAVIRSTRVSHPDWTVEHTDPQYLSQKYDRFTHVFVKVRFECPFGGVVDPETAKSLLPELLKPYGSLRQTLSLNVAGTDYLCLIAKFRPEGNQAAAAIPVNCFPFGSGQLRLIHVQKVPDDPAGFVNDYYGRYSVNLGPSRGDNDLAGALGRMSVSPGHPAHVVSGGTPGPGIGVGDPFWTPNPFVNTAANHPPNHPSAGFGYVTPIVNTAFDPSPSPGPVQGAVGLGNTYHSGQTGYLPGAIGQDRFDSTPPRSQNSRSWHNRRYSSGSGGRRGNNFVGMNNNTVDIRRIREGLDVRTTIMLRNIPNKIDQPMLKEIVDETSQGKYDFMYLRIDFANNCNVGYAFINFEDPYDIIDFVKARAGYRWNRFNSDKVAEVSYATIQGKDCLVAKFRNSSVMLELPSFRPKVFHTGTGPLAGTEAPFPPPDNHSKMRRSVENAAHVGLFSPGGGNNPRHDSRRRRSRWDRGTRLAQMEEANNFNPVDFPKIHMFPRLPGVLESMENQDQSYGGGPVMNHMNSQGFHGGNGPRSNFRH